jgi:flagellar biosynthesis GTPase FlhF
MTGIVCLKPSELRFLLFDCFAPAMRSWQSALWSRQSTMDARLEASLLFFSSLQNRERLSQLLSDECLDSRTCFSFSADMRSPFQEILAEQVRSEVSFPDRARTAKEEEEVKEKEKEEEEEEEEAVERWKERHRACGDKLSSMAWVVSAARAALINVRSQDALQQQQRGQRTIVDELQELTRNLRAISATASSCAKDFQRLRTCKDICRTQHSHFLALIESIRENKVEQEQHLAAFGRMAVAREQRELHQVEGDVPEQLFSKNRSSPSPLPSPSPGPMKDAMLTLGGPNPLWIIMQNVFSPKTD